MAIRVVRLGSPRAAAEGLRLGTVRRPPRRVPKAEYSSRDLYDVWLPELAPSEKLLKEGLGASGEQAWGRFVKRFRAEMKRPEAGPPCTDVRSHSGPDAIDRMRFARVARLLERRRVSPQADAELAGALAGEQPLVGEHCGASLSECIAADPRAACTTATTGGKLPAEIG